MLTENDVVGHVCNFLLETQYSITQRLSTDDRGFDVIAQRDGKTLLVEAKGETSSKQTTARFGKPFNSAQVKDHVANAFYTAAVRSKDHHRRCVAFPDTQLHRRYVEPVRAALVDLSIGLFWVGSDGSVVFDAPWAL